MNRFAHDNLDPSITMMRRLLVMTPTVGPKKLGAIYEKASGRGRKSTGYDRVAGERLALRRSAYDRMSTLDQVGCTRPGSMNRKKVG